jgi:hypothetical protein
MVTERETSLGWGGGEGMGPPVNSPPENTPCFAKIHLHKFSALPIAVPFTKATLQYCRYNLLTCFVGIVK